MFNSVYAPCPNCYADVEFQSKAGASTLANYMYEEVPQDIALDLNCSIEECPVCKTKVALIYQGRPKIVKMHIKRVAEYEDNNNLFGQ